MVNLTTEQRSIARDIASVGAARGLGVQGAVIGIMVGLTESGLRNVDHGDAPGPSSRGVFQQMPSWGSLTCRMDPKCAASRFYDALTGIRWKSMAPWVAAQRVQGSEFIPGFTGFGSDGTEGWNYLQNYDRAQQIFTDIGNPAPPTPSPGGPTVTPEQYDALAKSIIALADQIAAVRTDLDKLIHAQAAMVVNATVPYLEKIANKIGA